MNLRIKEHPKVCRTARSYRQARLKALYLTGGWDAGYGLPRKMRTWSSGRRESRVLVWIKVPVPGRKSCSSRIRSFRRLPVWSGRLTRSSPVGPCSQSTGANIGLRLFFRLLPAAPGPAGGRDKLGIGIVSRVLLCSTHKSPICGPKLHKEVAKAQSVCLSANEEGQLSVHTSWSSLSARRSQQRLSCKGAFRGTENLPRLDRSPQDQWAGFTFFKEGRFTGLGTASFPEGPTVVDRGLCIPSTLAISGNGFKSQSAPLPSAPLAFLHISSEADGAGTSPNVHPPQLGPAADWSMCESCSGTSKAPP